MEAIGKTLQMFRPLPNQPLSAQPFVILTNTTNGKSRVVRDLGKKKH